MTWSLDTAEALTAAESALPGTLHDVAAGTQDHRGDDLEIAR